MSSISETIESTSNNFRVRSFSKSHSRSNNKLQSNLINVMVLDGKEASHLK